MNERNTNRRAQTPGNRTTQRHQIDGRPAPRRQASHASDYSEGSFTQTSRSNTFRTGPRQSAQSSRPRQQQDRRQQPPQRGQQRPSQRHASSRRTTPSSRRTNRTPIHEQHYYQTLTPRQGTSTYVRHGYSKKRSNLPFFVGGAAALVVVIFLVTTLVGALGGSSQNTQEETLTAADYAQILVKGNVETASLANNHSRDYGEQSYTDTISALENAGIGTFGYDRIDYREVNGVKVALIGTYELAKHLDIQDELKQNIKTAKENGAQLVAVYFHWGTEKETVPDETQIQLGHIAVDEGADLVIGSHPHVIQGYEKYNGRYIVYSLGNFCFGGNPNPSDKDCMIFQQTFTVTGNDVATDDNINVIPCSISSVSNSNNYQPTPATGDEKTRIEAKIKKSSDSIATLSNKVSQSS